MSGYNDGQYDFQQQVFCMSMLTTLGFNLTGSAASIADRTKAAIENVLEKEQARQLIGQWDIVWGPSVYADSFIGAKASVNCMFIAKPKNHDDQAVVTIAGTNGNSLMDWVVEDFNAKHKIPWPYSQSSLNPKITKGIDYGLDKLVNLKDEDPDDTGGMVTAREFLANHPSLTQVMVTGHSLGGALSPAYSLYLEDTRAEWDESESVTISCLATAGQTTGDANFSKYYEEKLASTSTRVWNSMDIVPHVFNEEMLVKIPSLYEPNIPVKKLIQKFVDKIHSDVKGHDYLSILPETEGFPSEFIKLDDLAGRYKLFVDFIDNIVSLVKKILPFGAKDLMGSVGFIIHALIQHIIPYFTYFKIEEFAELMSDPSGRSKKKSSKG